MVGGQLAVLNIDQSPAINLAGLNAKYRSLPFCIFEVKHLQQVVRRLVVNAVGSATILAARQAAATHGGQSLRELTTRSYSC